MLQGVLLCKRKEMIQKEYFKRKCLILENLSNDLKKIVLFYAWNKTKIPVFLFAFLEEKQEFYIK